MSVSVTREALLAALEKPLPADAEGVHSDVFDPWADVISGIFGSYASQSDDAMIAALKAVRDRKTFEFIDTHGFLGEFILYVLAGHYLTEYGTSPRSGWPRPELADVWDQLIEKWEAYAAIVWNEAAT